MKQTTLKQSFTFSGIGVHSGENGSVAVHPAPADSGYQLKVGKYQVKIAPWRIDGSRQCSAVMVNEEITISMMEHVLSALFGMGVDNAIIEVLEGREIPILDGSALEIANKIVEAGVKELDAEQPYYQLTHDASAGAYGCVVCATPIREREFRITYTLDYPDSPLAQGTVEKVITPEVYLKEIAPARTFVMQSQIEAARKAGLGKGATTQNTLVINGTEVVNNSLRMKDELMAHKMLDLIGDLATVGWRLGAHVIATKSGHALNQKLAQDLRLLALSHEHPGGVMGIKDIRKVIPHRYPFLLVDRVLEIEPLVYVHAYKNLTGNEEFFNGHFPDEPIMPGVLQIEALAQAAAVGMVNPNRLAVLTGVDEVKFRRQVVPGDQLHLVGHILKYNGRIGVLSAKAMVNGELACSAVIKCAFIDKNNGAI